MLLRRSIVLILLSLLVPLAGTAQQSPYRILDEKCISVPDSLSAYQEIAVHLTRDLASSTEKLRAIFIWIAHAINYDPEAYSRIIGYDSVHERLEQTLRTRRGVCQHYAELFEAMASHVGIESHVIGGYTRDDRGVDREMGHAWNAVRIDTSYFLIDVTWASGYMLNGTYVHHYRDHYFLVPPKQMLRTHMPYDPLWQFIDPPLTHSEFITADFSNLENSVEPSFRDRITEHLALNEMDRMEGSHQRIVAAGLETELLEEYVNVSIDQLMSLRYNNAVELLNSGVNEYNHYIKRKNEYFRKPKLKDEEIQELIRSAGSKVHHAIALFAELQTQNNEYQELLRMAREQLPEIQAAVDKETAFVERYLRTWRPFRMLALVYG